MKKMSVALCLCAVVFGLAACGPDEKDGGNDQDPVQTGGTATPEPTAEPQEEEPEEPFDVSNGWSEEMTGLRQAVVDALGEENYWPNAPLQDAAFFEERYGLSSDQYLDFMAEIPMISVNVDTLVIVRARQAKVADVEAALNAYRDSQINGAQQYPINLGKVQASKVETIGNYVVFVMLGEGAGDSVEADIAACQQTNDQAIEAIREKLEQ